MSESNAGTTVSYFLFFPDLASNVSKIFRAEKKPWKVGEIRSLISWKKLQLSSDEYNLQNFKEFCDENEVFYYIIELDRTIKVAPTKYSVKISEKVKVREVALPEGVGGDKRLYISNFNLRGLPEVVVRDAIFGNPAVFSILDLTQENIDKIYQIYKIRERETELVNAEAEIIFQQEQEADEQQRAIDFAVNASARKKENRNAMLMAIASVPAYIAISFLFGAWSIIPLILGIVIVPAIVGLVIGVAKDTGFGIMAFVVTILLFAVSINMSKLIGRDYFAGIESRNEQNAAAEKRNEISKNGPVIINKILNGEKLDNSDLSKIGLGN